MKRPFSFIKLLLLGLHTSSCSSTFLTFQLHEDTENTWWEDLILVIYCLSVVHVPTPVSTLEQWFHL